MKTKSANAISPCGACRQFLSEVSDIMCDSEDVLRNLKLTIHPPASGIQFCTDMTIYMVQDNRSYVTKQLKELLPLSFGKDELDSGVLK